MHEALPRIRGLMQKVLHAHGAHHGDMLRQVHDLYNALDTELTSHLRKEEEVLFPVHRGCRAHRQGGPEGPAACFGSVGNPICQMEAEHESAGEVLVQIRKVTGGYTLPDDACPTFRALYEELERMEARPPPAHPPRKQHPVPEGDRCGVGPAVRFRESPCPGGAA